MFAPKILEDTVSLFIKKFAPKILQDTAVTRPPNEGVGCRECLNYKSGLRILIWPLEVPFFWSQRWALLAKVTVFGPQKMALRVAKSKF